MRALLFAVFILPLCLVCQETDRLDTVSLTVLPYHSEVIGTGDLDGDGRADYLLANTAHIVGGVLSWVPYAADGVIRMPRVIPVAGGVNSMVVDDVDDDGDQDLLYHIYAGGEDPQFYWTENVHGDGLTWRTHVVSFTVVRSGNHDPARFGDIDGNGYTDIVYTSHGSIRYILGAPGGFGRPTPIVKFGGTHDNMTGYLADADGDGVKDLVYEVEGADYMPDTLRYHTFTGRTDGGFNPPEDLITYRGWLLPPFDYDSDGRLDPAVNFLDSVYIHPSAPGQTSPVKIPHDAYDILATDLTGDGQNDLIFIADSLRVLPVLDGLLQPLITVENDLQPRRRLFIGESADGTRELLAHFHFPGLGHLPGRVDLDDFVFGSANPSPLWYPADLSRLGVEPARPGAYATYLAPGYETYPGAVYRVSPEKPDDRTWYTVQPVFVANQEVGWQSYDADVDHIVHADFNRDGFPDFVFEFDIHAQSGPVSLVAMSEGRPGAYRHERVPEYVMGNSHTAYDRTLDLPDRFPITVVNDRYREGCTVRVFYHNDGDGHPDREQCLQLFPEGTTWENTGEIAAPDLNHDGHSDLVIIRGNLPPAYLPFDPATGTYGDPVDLPFPWRSIPWTVGDVNGDNFADLAALVGGERWMVITDYQAGKFSLHKGETFTYLTSTDATWQAMDLDDDGRDELLYLGEAGRLDIGFDESVWRQSFTPGTPVATDGLPADKLGRHLLADVDGDGDTDLLFTDDRLLYLTNLARDARYTIATFHDADGDGLRGASEPLLPGVRYAFSDLPLSIRRDRPDGWTTLFTTGAGKTRLTADAGPLWEVRPEYIDVTVGANPKAPLAIFAAVPSSTVHAADLSLTTGRMRCNTEVPVWVTVRNTGNQIVPASFLSIATNSELEVRTTPDSVADGRLYYRTDAVLPGGSLMLPLLVQAPGVDVLPLTVELEVEFDHLAGTEVNHLRTGEFAEVLCSYDPNDKRVIPKGLKKEGYISENTPLLYTIRFQNTGNDTAYQVVLRDTLDAGLDLSTLKFAGSSHLVHTEVADSTRALTFSFFDIMLVDSATNDPGSQGYVRYRIEPHTGFSYDEEITNRASIYFDYNPPIVTNQTLNTVIATKEPTTSVTTTTERFGMWLSPNPTKGPVRLALLGEDWRPHLQQTLNLELTTIWGQPVRSWTLTGNQMAMNLGDLPAGVYVLSARSSGRKLGVARLVVH